jgi:ribonuclease P protein component
MLKKKERLDRVTFNRFFSVGKRFHSPSLMLIYAPFEAFHASAVAPKKLARTAVLRNKFRRRIYDAFGRLQNEKAFTGVFICVAKEGAPQASYDVLKEELGGLIRKIGVVR